MQKYWFRKYLLIVDYNLSRIRDVAHMRDYAREKYNLLTILIRPLPSRIDYEISDIVFDIDPRAADFLDCATMSLKPYTGHIAAGLVFSDNAVYQGALLLEKLGLRVDNGNLANGAFSKEAYRHQEQAHREILEPQSMFLPESQRIRQLDDLKAFAAKHANGCVIKPSCEGNNRGVVVLRQGHDLRQAMQEIGSYVKDGVVCEQIIPFRREFSFDGLGFLSFITEKLSAEGRYPVEIGQLLPARANSEELQTLRRIGQLANLLVGQKHGPFHNEIKISDDGLSAGVVEPNRRPAGMKIWSLAQKVYGLDFYHLWVDQVMEQCLPNYLPQPLGQAAVIMLGAPIDGYLNQYRIGEDDSFFKQNVVPVLQKSGVMPTSTELEWFDFTWLHKASESGSLIHQTPRDNSDFVAQICVYTSSHIFDLHAFVLQVQDSWKQSLFEHMVVTQHQSTQPKRLSAA